MSENITEHPLCYERRVWLEERTRGFCSVEGGYEVDVSACNAGEEEEEGELFDSTKKDLACLLCSVLVA